jgi:hypothetical protein
LSDTLRGHVERTMRFALTRYTHSLDSVTVTLSDENGSRESVEKRCHVVIHLRPAETLLIDESDSGLAAAASRAAHRASRAVLRRLEDRR